MAALKNIVVTDIKDFVTVIYNKQKPKTIENRNCSAITFCMQGQRIYYQNGIEYSSDPGHVIFLPQGQGYTIYAHKNGIYPVINFLCPAFPSNTILRLPIENVETYIREYEQMKNLFLFENNKLKVMSIFYDMLHRIYTHTKVNQRRLIPAIKYMEKNYSNHDISNDLLASLCNISEVHFRKLFKENFDKSPKQYILDMRIQKAKQLLSDGMFKISAISRECGFSDQYHFSRIFKQKTGMTPTEYYKKNQIIEHSSDFM